MSLAGPTTTLTAVQGAQLTRVLQGYNLDGTIPTTFLNTDVLTGKIWLANAETPVVSFTPTWFAAGSCQVTVPLTAANTTALSLDSTYNLQVFASRSGGDPYCIAWVYLQVLPAAGSATAPTLDLISGAYAIQMLQQLTLTPAQLEQIPNLITAVSSAWRKWCKRDFWQATYTELCEVELDGYIRVKQIPVNQIYSIRNLPDIALTVANTTAQQAYIGWTITGDVATGQTITGMTATDIINGVTTARTVVYSANETIATLATAIGALGNGWTASVNGTYGTWPVTEIIDGAIAKGACSQDTPDGGAVFNVFSSVVTNAYFHPDDGQRTGMIYVGRQYTTTTPRWGPGWEEMANTVNDTGSVKISYNGGYAVVPQEVQAAVAEHVKYTMSILNTDLLLKSETANKYSYDLATDCIEMLPRHVRQVMNLWTIRNA